MATKTRRVSGQSLAVEGLRPLLRALKNTEERSDMLVKSELREIGNSVRDRAQANVQHKTGRHGTDGPIKVKTGVTQKGVSVFASAPHSNVQNFGGRVGKGAVIPRASASGYMTKGVRESMGEVEAAVVQIGRKIVDTYGKG